MFGLEGENILDDVAEVGEKSPILWIDDCREIRLAVAPLPPTGVCAFAGYLGGQHALARDATQEQELGATALAKTLSDGPPSKALLTDLAHRLRLGAGKIADVELGPDARQQPLLLRSFGGPYKMSDVAPANDPSKSELTLGRGLSLIGFEHGGEPRVLEHIDTCSNATLSTDKAGSFSDRIRKASAAGRYDLFGIVVHDSAVCHPIDLQPLFAGLPLHEWARLRTRIPYVALVDSAGKRLNEFVGRPGGSLAVRLLPAGKD
jgi:hypothetical protein